MSVVRVLRASARPQLLGILLLLGVGFLTACGPRLITSTAPGESTLEVEAIAVYPLRARLQFPPETSYAKTVDMVNAVLAPRRFAVYSFGDFQTFATESSAAYEGESLLSVIRTQKIDPNKLAILKGEVVFWEDTNTSGSSSQDGHRWEERTEVQVWVELYHYGQKVVVARAETKFKLDPLQADLADRFPELTTQITRLTEAVVKLTEARAITPAQHPKLPLSFYSDHSLLFELESDEGTSVAKEMLSMDEVDKSMALLREYQRFYPDISLLDVQRLNDAPGVLVTGIQSPWVEGDPLRIGDVITAVEGVSIRNAHQFDRQIQHIASGAEIQCTVQRGGDALPLSVTMP